MKKLSLIFIYALLATSLFATYYSSNILGQKKMRLEEFSPSGYVVEVLANKEILYSDSKVIKTTSFLEHKEIIEEEGQVSTKEFNQEGLLISLEVETSDNVSKLNYEYTKDNIIKRILKTVNQEIVEITLVNYSSLGGLSSIIKDENISYFDNSKFLYTRNDSNVFIDASLPSLLVKRVTNEDSEVRGQEIIYLEDAFFIREQMSFGFEDTYYLPNGKIDKIIATDEEHNTISVKTFTYEEDLLVKEVFQEDNRVESTNYENGKAVNCIVEIDNIISSEFIYNADMTQKEFRYRDGSPYVEILYDFDGINVLDVVVL